jgi:hypothetical protein
MSAARITVLYVVHVQDLVQKIENRGSQGCGSASLQCGSGFSFNLNANPDPAFQFNTNLDPDHYQSDVEICDHWIGLQTLRDFILNF